MRCYSVYINNYDKAAATLADCMKVEVFAQTLQAGPFRTPTTLHARPTHYPSHPSHTPDPSHLSHPHKYTPTHTENFSMRTFPNMHTHTHTHTHARTCTRSSLLSPLLSDRSTHLGSNPSPSAWHAAIHPPHDVCISPLIHQTLEALSDAKHMTLASYLILPIQRMPRYVMLLEVRDAVLWATPV